MKKRYFYKIQDKSNRPIRELGAENYTVTGKGGLYNENLTIDEIALLRNLMWDYRKKYPDSQHEFNSFIHTWMFTNKKNPIVFTDIISHIESGVDIEGFDP